MKKTNCNTNFSPFLTMEKKEGRAEQINGKWQALSKWTRWKKNKQMDDGFCKFIPFGVDMKQITTEESNKQQMINLKINSEKTWRREKRWDLVSSICWSLCRNPDGSAIASPVSLLGYSGLECRFNLYMSDNMCDYLYTGKWVAPRPIPVHPIQTSTRD